jgi:hypothetical protein
LPRPCGFRGEETRFRFGHHAATFEDFDRLEDRAGEIRVGGEIGLERGAIGTSKTNRLPIMRPSSISGPA